MPFGDGIRLVREAIKQQAEERAWQLYVSAYPHFTKKSFKTFEQFYPRSKKKPKAIRKVTQEEMNRFADVADLMKSRKGKK